MFPVIVPRVVGTPLNVSVMVRGRKLKPALPCADVPGVKKLLPHVAVAVLVPLVADGAPLKVQL